MKKLFLFIFFMLISFNFISIYANENMTPDWNYLISDQYNEYELKAISKAIDDEQKYFIIVGVRDHGKLSGPQKYKAATFSYKKMGDFIDVQPPINSESKEQEVIGHIASLIPSSDGGAWASILTQKGKQYLYFFNKNLQVEKKINLSLNDNSLILYKIFSIDNFIYGIGQKNGSGYIAKYYSDGSIANEWVGMKLGIPSGSVVIDGIYNNKNGFFLAGLVHNKGVEKTWIANTGEDFKIKNSQELSGKIIEIKALIDGGIAVLCEDINNNQKSFVFY